MLPQEHGAYGQLLLPIATAFVIGRFRWPAAALAAAAVCAFVAHEPLLVLLGQRGSRAQRERRQRAWVWLMVAGGAALMCGAVAAVTLSPSGRVAFGVTVVLGALLALLIAVGREHTLFGESWTGATMGALAAPMALAGDAPLRTAVTLACAFAAAFVAPTAAVHAVIACTRRPPAISARATSGAVTLVILAVVAALARVGFIASSGLWAALPACAASLVLVVRPPSARRLRAVGWTLVATSTAAAAILIADL